MVPIHKTFNNIQIRLINLKGKEFVLSGSKNFNWTDHITEKSLFA
jgi:hypothetical protein